MKTKNLFILMLLSWMLVIGCSKEEPLAPETENGVGWRAINSGLPEQTTVQTIASNRNGSVLYAGTFDGVYRSENSGASWSRKSNGLDARDISCLAMAPQNSLIAVAGSWGKGLYKTTDGGETWQSVWSGDKSPHINAVQYSSDGSTLWVATQHGLFRSADGGQTWVHAFKYGKIRTVAVHPINANIIYLGIRWHGNFRSSDGGESWQEINTGVYTTGQEYAAANAFIFDPRNPNRMVMSTGWVDLYESQNGGESWKRVADVLYEKSVLALGIAEIAPQQIWAITEDDGVFASQDGSSKWLVENTGIEDFKVKALRVAPTSGDVFVGTLGKGIFKYVVAE